ncbi:S53 family peptidase [Lentilactobacillus diolivorans]|uniref:S53 family peptidase n=1 Tax=Lentilactobacillus diolivorans TaxID=179838 RepID=UPI0024689478|nr:S53 family peptidase [Lentilactobacillus diolivorans]MDH5104226.1 S53 family peptidase [Lentilactobacillus diolivorans]
MKKDMLRKILISAAVLLSLVVGGSNLLTSSVDAKARATKAKTTQVANSKQQLVDIVMKPKSQQNLDDFVYDSVDPGNINYRKFVSAKQFAAQFGQNATNIKKLRVYLNKNHLKTTVYRGNLIMSVTGTTKNIERAFKVNLVNVTKGSLKYQKAIGTARVPKTLNRAVYAIMGLSNYSPFSNTKRTFSPASFHKLAETSGSSGISPRYSPQKFVNRYSLSSLYANGSTGRNKTIGIITFANYHPSDAYKYWAGQGITVKQNRLSVYRTNEYAGTWDGYDETTMDVEQAGAIAPDANIRTYIGRSNITGMVNSLAAAVGQNSADALSISWGQSEAQVAYEIKQGITPAKYNQILNLLFEQAAAQGMSVFTAAGDNGAYDGISTGLTKGLSVDTPSNSPYVTSVGGTTLPKTYTVNGNKVTVSKERAWGSEFLYPNYDHQKFFNTMDMIDSYFTGGGGGFSKYNDTPKYQKGFSGVGTYEATKLWSFNKNGQPKQLSTPVEISGKQQGRNVPDISANADPATGYTMFVTPKHNAADKGEWEISGGTSIVAPQIAATSVLMSDNSAGRLGFWNPQIYRFAASHDTPFTVLDSRTNNTNLYYTGQPGKLYNQATGLGTVDFTKLNNAFNG